MRYSGILAVAVCEILETIIYLDCKNHDFVLGCPIAEPICTGDETPIQQQFTFYTSNYNIAELMKELKLPMLDNMLDEYVGHHPAVFECATHRDICYQSCGSTIDLCWNAFNQCLSKR